MKNQYVFLDDDGNEKSTLKTPFSLTETDKIIKVDDVERYIGKKIVNGNPIEIMKKTPSEPMSIPFDLSAATEEEKWAKLFNHLGIPIR